MADDLTRHFPTTTGRVHVVPPAVELHHDHAIVPGGPPLFLFMGPGDPRKDVGTFQRAFALLRARHPGAQAFIVGEAGRVFARRELRPGPGETWSGRVDDDALFTLMRRATALVMPSRYEGFGLPILEALARGCPVIASDLPVFRDTFGEAPVRVPAGDAATLADAMNGLIVDPQARTTRIGAGLAVAARFSFAAQDAALQQALRARVPELSR